MAMPESIEIGIFYACGSLEAGPDAGRARRRERVIMAKKIDVNVTQIGVPQIRQYKCQNGVYRRKTGHFRGKTSLLGGFKKTIFSDMD